MRGGSAAVEDCPSLNALLDVASGASSVSFHHGGRVGIGNSPRAGQVIVGRYAGDGGAPGAGPCQW